MTKENRNFLIKGIIGISFFVVGIILLIVGFCVKRPVVTFLNEDGSVLAKVNISVGGHAVSPAKPEKAAEKGYIYVFDKWDPEPTDVQDNVTCNPVFRKVARIYNVIYEVNKGEAIAKDTYTIEKNLILPIPTKYGCTFEGWYTNATFSSTKVTEIKKGSTEDKTFFAKWSAPSFELNYFLDGGSFPSEYVNSYTIQDEVTLPIPEKASYTFGGWYDNPEFNGTAIATIKEGTEGNKTLYAKWVYQINYHLNDGFNVKLSVATYEGNEDVILPIPYKTSLAFSGWYNNPEFTGESISTILSGTSGNLDLYAKWVSYEEGVVFTEGNNQYVFFGNYQQNVVTDFKEITELKKLADIKENGKSTGYYKEGYYTYKNNKYYCATAQTAGIAYRFDHDVQTSLSAKSNAISSDNVYFFNVQPIKWLVLAQDNNQYTLISNNVLESKAFDNDMNNYANSDIRKWLNEEFYNNAFSEDNKAMIKTVSIDNSSSSTSSKTQNPNVCENTLDNVTLLSYKDAVNANYKFNIFASEEDRNRTSMTTEYARATNTLMETLYSHYCLSGWLLRSPSYFDTESCSYVTSHGEVKDTIVTNEKVGIRPVITITIE